MAGNRPPIPENIRAEILREARHHCSVCPESLVLEMAHIVPFSKTNDHSPENLICLCPNCHAKADLRKWGESELRYYKKNPWVLRVADVINHEQKVAEIGVVDRRDVVIVIQGKAADFNDIDRFNVKNVVAHTLKMNPDDIKIKGVEDGSVIITLSLPTPSALELVEIWHHEPDSLRSSFSGYVLENVRPTDLDASSIAQREECFQRFSAPKPEFGLGGSVQVVHSRSGDTVYFFGPRVGSDYGHSRSDFSVVSVLLEVLRILWDWRLWLMVSSHVVILFLTIYSKSMTNVFISVVACFITWLYLSWRSGYEISRLFPAFDFWRRKVYRESSSERVGVVLMAKPNRVRSAAVKALRRFQR